jgi:hypothetical protein|uniref:Replication protein n=1 Tax=Pseudomonas sp. S-47 TaxID=115714 RepID=Q58HA6_9PSED|nr:replication initiation factor domain-containing protein [Pseudomonas sp. S-47]AAX51984.1 replication protein [Pseudomonas sp. S-47]
MLARNAKFDWYQSTVLVADPQDSGLVDHLLKAWPLTDWAPARNLNGYTHGGAIIRGDRILCHLCWGGQTGVNCKTSSSESGVLAEALATFGKQHLPTRVDSAMDWYEDGLFDSMAALLIDYAQDARLTINQQGDWIRGEGRTLYVGSTDSPVRVVLYEKGYEQGGDAPRNWVRLEVRVRPKREWRSTVARWTAEDVFCAGWAPRALQALGWDDLESRSIGTVWKRSDDERARAALVKQYGGILDRWMTEAGSWEALGALLGRAIQDVGAPLGNTAKSSSPSPIREEG